MEQHRDPKSGQAWPLFGLSVVHEDLLLREATDDDILALAQIVEDGVVQAGEEHFMPHLLLGRAPTVEERYANFLRYHWGRRSTTGPDKWDLSFAVLLEGRVIGSQAIHTTDFPLLREIHTGSYLARHVQGRGVGHRMRALVLELAFAHLGAKWATSGFVEGNERSRRVSARLGYQDDGIKLLAGSGCKEAIESHRLRLRREFWFKNRPSWLDSVNWAGIDAARTFLGL